MDQIMERKQYKFQIDSASIKLDFTIDVKIFQENEHIIFYSPQLDICSYALTKEQAEDNFSNTLKLYCEFEYNKGRLEEVIEKIKTIFVTYG